MKSKKIAVIGAGPKSIAIGAKADVLREAGKIDISVDVYEEHEIAANWIGAYGHTDGKQKLGTPP